MTAFSRFHTEYPFRWNDGYAFSLGTWKLEKMGILSTVTNWVSFPRQRESRV